MHEKMIEYNKKISGHSLPKWKELPDIELYMDQVIALMQKYLQPYSALEDTLTPSMINNYVKMDALPAPVKKKYSREHLCRLIIICLIKKQLPITVISAVIEDQVKKKGLEVFYNGFTEIYESYVKSTAEHVSEDEDLSEAAIKLSALASSARLAAENAVSVLAPPVQKKEKKEKKK